MKKKGGANTELNLLIKMSTYLSHIVALSLKNCSSLPQFSCLSDCEYPNFSSFLTRGVYDPRLLLHIAAFALMPQCYDINFQRFNKELCFGSSTDTKVALHTRSEIFVIDLVSKNVTILQTNGQYHIFKCGFSQTGNQIVATILEDPLINYMWDLTSKQIFPDIIEFIQKGKYIVQEWDSKFIQIVDAFTGIEQFKLDDRRDELKIISVSPDNVYLATCNRNSIIRVWNMTSHTQYPTINCIQITPNFIFSILFLNSLIL